MGVLTYLVDFLKKKAVQKYIAENTDFYMSDHDGINRIFAAYGGNYEIPLFKE